jgi:hypothetical protein
MDQSRKVLNAECSRHAKAIEEKEGLKTVMSLSEQEFRDREKEMNKVGFMSNDYYVNNSNY